MNRKMTINLIAAIVVLIYFGLAFFTIYERISEPKVLELISLPVYFAYGFGIMLFGAFGAILFTLLAAVILWFLVKWFITIAFFNK